MKLTIRKFSRRSFFAGLFNLIAVRAVAGPEVSDGGLWKICQRSVGHPHALALGRSHLKDEGVQAVKAHLASRFAGSIEMFGTDIAIDGLVRDDFRTGRLVQVEGWVLSRTEAAVMAYGAWALSAG